MPKLQGEGITKIGFGDGMLCKDPYRGTGRNDSAMCRPNTSGSIVVRITFLSRRGLKLHNKPDQILGTLLHVDGKIRGSTEMLF